MKEIVINALGPGVLAAERERELKEYGLRPVFVSNFIMFKKKLTYPCGIRMLFGI